MFRLRPIGHFQVKLYFSDILILCLLLCVVIFVKIRIRFLL
jgi:hypothetical protein